MAESHSDRDNLIVATCHEDRCTDMGTYDMTGRCQNCKWEGTIRYTRGHVKSPQRCPRCACARCVFAHDFMPANTEESYAS